MKKIIPFLLLLNNLSFCQITIKPITLEKEDLIIAGDLLNHLLQSYPNLYPTLDDEKLESLKISIVRCLQNNWHIFLASDDDQPNAHGLIALTIIPRFPLLTNRARIQNFIVKNGNTSFKEEMLAFAENYCREQKCDFIEVIPQKRNGDVFYKPHGYNNEESEVYLWKQL